MAKDIFADRYSAMFKPQTAGAQSTYVSPYRFGAVSGTPTEEIPAENPEYVRPSFLERVESQIQAGPFKTLGERYLPSGVYEPMRETLNLLDTPARATHGALRGAWDAASVAARAAESGDPLLAGLAVTRGVGTLAMGGLAGLTPAGITLIAGTEALGKQIPAVREANEYLMAPFSKALIGDLESKEGYAKYQQLSPEMREVLGIADVGGSIAMFGGVHNAMSVLNKRVGPPVRQMATEIKRNLTPLPKESLGVDPSKLPPRIRDYYVNEFLQQAGPTPEGKVSSGKPFNRYSYREIENSIVEDLDGPYLRLWNEQLIRGRKGESMMDFLMRAQETAGLNEIQPKNIKEIGFWSDAGYSLTAQEVRKKADTIFQAMTSEKPRDGFKSERDRVYWEAAQAFRKYDPLQIDNNMAILDARAKVWGEMLGKDPDEYFKSMEVRRATPGEEVAGRPVGGELRLAQQDLTKSEPEFYSVLQQNIEQKMPERAGVLQIRNIINQYAPKDEVKWTGLDDFLEANKDRPITKQEVMKYLDENAVKVNEVWKSESGKGRTYATLADVGAITDPTAMRKQADKLLGSDNPYDKEMGVALSRGIDTGRIVTVIPDLNGIGVPGWVYKDENGKYTITLHTNDRFDTPTQANEFAINTYNATHGSNTRPAYAQYSTEGGENYREVLFTIPAESATGQRIGEKFNEGHWQEPNVLAHARMSDFTTKDGKRVLYIEEIQSDLHQKGREMGYAPPAAEVAEKRRVATENRNVINDKLVKLFDGKTIPFENIRIRYVGNLESPNARMYTQDTRVYTPKSVRRRGETSYIDLIVQDGTGHSVTHQLDYQMFTPREFRGRFTSPYEVSTDGGKTYRSPEELLGVSQEQFKLADYRGTEQPPQAPFSKTWHEMVLRRLTQQAAREGYDYVAWTPGNHQVLRWSGSEEAEGGMPAFYDEMLVKYGNHLAKKFGSNTMKLELPGIRTESALDLREAKKAFKEGKEIYYTNEYEHGATLVDKENASVAFNPENESFFFMADEPGKTDIKRESLPRIQRMDTVEDVTDMWETGITYPNQKEARTVHAIPITEKMKAPTRLFQRGENAWNMVPVEEMTPEVKQALKRMYEEDPKSLTYGEVQKPERLQEIGMSEFDDIDQVLDDPRNIVKINKRAADVPKSLQQQLKGLSGERRYKQGESGKLKGTFHVEDNKRIITAFQAADISTMVHEVGHVFRRDLSGGLLKQTEDFAGVKGGKWDEAAEEKFANAFTEYLRTGKAPTGSSYQLRKVFDNFKRWLTELYDTISQREPAVVSDQIREVFDALLTGPRGVIEAMNYEGWGPNRAEGPITHTGVPALGAKTPYLYTDMRTGGTYAMPQEDVTRTNVIEQLRNKRKQFGASVLKQPGMGE